MTGGNRLHPAAIALWPLGQVRSLLVLAFAGTRQSVVAAAVLATFALASVIRWWRFRYAVEGRTLIIAQGLLVRHRRAIPLDRLQSVDVVRRVRHRLFGVVELRIETVGGSDTEGRLEALAPAQARRLRAALLGQTGDLSDAAPAMSGEPLVQLGPRQLVAAGLTGGRVGVFAALLGFADELAGDRISELFPRLLGLGVPGVAGLVGGGAVAAFGLSVAATVLVYWNFTLLRDDAVLRVRRGLFEQRLQTIPLQRIQAVRMEENLVRRWLGLASVKVDVAGRSGAEEAQQTSLLLPLGSRQTALELLAGVLDRAELAEGVLEPMPARARTKRLARALLVAGAGTGVGVTLYGPPGLFLALLLVPCLVAAFASFAALGWAQTAGAVVARSGWLVRRTSVVPVDRLQSLALRVSPFQRLRRLATLELQIARSAGSRDPRLIDLDAANAAELLRVVRARGRHRTRSEAGPA